MARYPGLRILAKEPLFKIPFLGLMMKLTGQIPISSGVESYWAAMKEVREALRRGQHVHIFPEMKRCEFNYEGVDRFQNAPFWLAIKENVPVHVIAMGNTDRAWAKGDMGLSFREPIFAKSVADIRVDKFSDHESLREEVHRILLNYLAGEMKNAS